MSYIWAENFSFAALFRGVQDTYEIDNALGYIQPQNEVDTNLLKKCGYGSNWDPRLIKGSVGRRFNYWCVRQTFTGITDVAPKDVINFFFTSTRKIVHSNIFFKIYVFGLFHKNVFVKL